jgi:peptidoglycan/LPS O-acetylase OafA/YrhL
MTNSPSISPGRTRLRGIDALRGAAALGVVVYHAVDQSAKALPHNFLQYPARLVQVASSFGYIGVFLFFVISGFCIHLQWAKSKAAGVNPEIRFIPFWKRRIRRLYPPYLIALLLFMLVAASTTGIKLTQFFFYDLGMHLLMLHNLDAKTAYTINGVFWTLAIEEQLYLAYFLLLFIRIRWGWGVTLGVCLLARLGWMGFSHIVWLKTGGFGLPVPEAAASHWFTWALGAIGVEAMLGLVKLPRWSRDLRLATVLIVSASVLSSYLPAIYDYRLIHDVSWFLMHPMWGLGFFIVVNRMVLAEDSWLRQARLPSLVSFFATLGIFSYSLYLTHELIIMQSWQWTNPGWLQLVNVVLVMIPATIVFAWLFFWFCEKPFMAKRAAQVNPQITQITQILQEESV